MNTIVNDAALFSNCTFQLSCHKCYIIFHQIEEIVLVDDIGSPLLSEVKKVFDRGEFNVNTKCTCCGNKILSKIYSYSPRFEKEDENDLPF